MLNNGLDEESPPVWVLGLFNSMVDEGFQRYAVWFCTVAVEEEILEGDVVGKDGPEVVVVDTIEEGPGWVGYSVWACGSKEVFLPRGLCRGLGRAEGVGVGVGEVNLEAFSWGGGGIPGGHGGMERRLRCGGGSSCAMLGHALLLMLLLFLQCSKVFLMPSLGVILKLTFF